MTVEENPRFALLAGLLRDGYRVRFRAHGRSMHPTIQEGERITVEPVESSEVKAGDVVLYRAGLGVVAHSVVRRERRSGPIVRFLLRGDSSDCCDDPVAAAQVLGRVVCVEREGRDIDLAGRTAKVLGALRARASRFKRRVLAAGPA